MTQPDAAAVWARMADLVIHANRRPRQVSEALQMSFAKAQAVRYIAAGPLTMGELAEQLLTDRPYATLLVNDLERRGLVERTVYPADRRRKVVKATQEGRKVAAIVNRILGEPPPALLALPEADLAALDRILAKLSAAAAPTAPTGNARS